jgi:hypothetical protein
MRDGEGRYTSYIDSRMLWRDVNTECEGRVVMAIWIATK